MANSELRKPQQATAKPPFAYDLYRVDTGGTVSAEVASIDPFASLT